MKDSLENNNREFVVKNLKSRKFIIAGGIIACSLAIISWYLYEYHYLPSKPIPLLTAEEGPTKIKPEKADGALVPNIDKIVYDTLKPGYDSTRLASMMPEPEQPLEVGAMNNKDVIEDIIGKVLSDEPQPKHDEEIIAPEVPALHQKAPEENIKTLQIIPIENQGTKNQQKILKVQSFYKIQLASVRTKEIAEKEGERLKKLHHKTLGSLSFSVQRIDVKDRGVFFRLLAGKFVSSSGAKSVCKKLIAAQQRCIVVKD